MVGPQERCFACGGRRRGTALELVLMSVADIQAEAMGLPPEQRAQLIDLLWDSLGSSDLKSREAAWAGESERRIDAFESGKLGAREAGSVFSDLRRNLRQ